MIITNSNVAMSGASQSNITTRETERTKTAGGGITSVMLNYNKNVQKNQTGGMLLDSYVKSGEDTKTPAWYQDLQTKYLTPAEDAAAKISENAAEIKNAAGQEKSEDEQKVGKRFGSEKYTQQAQTQETQGAASLSEAIYRAKEDLEAMLILRMLKALGLKTSDFRDNQKIQTALNRQSSQSQNFSLSIAGIGNKTAARTANTTQTEDTARPGYRMQKMYFETERTTETSMSQSYSFNMAAQVKTADGKIINVDINLNMSSEFYHKASESIKGSFMQEVKMTDPLIINFDASSAMLSKTKFSFDIDLDGTPDQISMLEKGSGFLALDKNSDGMINDGSELFGAATGNGFGELSEYDSDKNGWIDEADEIYNSLRIWMLNDDGTNTLVGLGEMGIGAIYLGSAAGDYSLGGMENPDGMIRRTGFFLNENGTAGTVQHVDLAI